MKTFVVRLFVSAEQEPVPAGSLLRGVVEEVASGRRSNFAGAQELAAFLIAQPEMEPAQPLERSTS